MGSVNSPLQSLDSLETHRFDEGVVRHALISEHSVPECDFVKVGTGGKNRPPTAAILTMKGRSLSPLTAQSLGYAGIWRQFSRCEGRDRCGVHAAWPSAFRVCAMCILSGTHRARLLTTPLYRLPLSSKPLESLAESLRNRHGARTPPQPSRAGRGRLTRATGGRTIGAGRVTADAEAATANPTPAADQPASPETLRLYAADWAAFEDWCRGRALATLPADPGMVAAFLTAGADTLGAGALGRRAAAIAAKHRQTGLASPAADPAVTAFLRAARHLSSRPR